jgi:hypothetical protein
VQRLTNSQLEEMLLMQHVTNTRVNPDWRNANYAWSRAIRVECAELSDHLGWKWWKKQEPNWPQAKIELVDIWHFMLSAAIVGARGDLDQAIRDINGGLCFPHLEVIECLGKKFTLNGLTLHEKVDTLSAFASMGYTFPALFELIMSDCGMTWADLRSGYMAKNVLNMFRQDHGYKEGTYVKSWHGVEDNVRLEQILAEKPELTAEELRAELWKIYETVAEV